MKTILSNLWAHRKQNGWIFVEIVLISCLSWMMTDHLTTSFYAIHLCTPAGEFEKDHLCVGAFSIVRGESESGDGNLTPEEAQDIYVIKEKLKALPEVESVCLTNDYLNRDLQMYYWRTMAPSDDTTRTVGFRSLCFFPDEQFFETHGLKAIEGSPDAQTLSREVRDDGVVVTRSIARSLFGHDQVVGKRVALVDHLVGNDSRDLQVWGYHTIRGVVEDVKGAPEERYPYVAFFPTPASILGVQYRQVMVRLKPEADAEAFVRKLKPTLLSEFRAGVFVLAELETYRQHYAAQMGSYNKSLFRQLAAVGLVLFAVIVVLGILGTYSLQVRGRTEDIGIMRSFGAKRRHIFMQLWGEGMVLTVLACLVGQLIWLQFVINLHMLSDGGSYGASGRETDWVSQPWQHFLVVSLVQTVVMMAVVTLGIVVPALVAVRKKPVEALRHE